jgi:hypothetical protein
LADGHFPHHFPRGELYVNASKAKLIYRVALTSCSPASGFWTPVFGRSSHASGLTIVVNEGGAEVPTFCPGDHRIAIINIIAVVMSIISDVVSMISLPIRSNYSVLALPVLKVVRLNITRRQKVALIALFAFGILVCGLDVSRGGYLLVEGTSQPGIDGSIILYIVQGNLAIMAANIPILRPLFFARSFGSSTGGSTPGGNASGGSSHGLPWGKRQRAIQLGDVASEYGGPNTVVSGGLSRTSTEHILEAGSIMKSMEVRVETTSAVSSIHQAE